MDCDNISALQLALLRSKRKNGKGDSAIPQSDGI